MTDTICFSLLGQISSTNQFCSMCHLTRIITTIHRTSHATSASFQQLPIASAQILSRNITDLSATFTPGRQEDSDEFLNCLLNHLVKCLTATDSPTITSRSYTTIDNLFKFGINSLITCNVCKQKTFKSEPGFVWNVPINGYTSLPDALDGFCQVETMSDDNAYHCKNCCKHVRATKSLSITDVSPYLIISLKRFEHFGLKQNKTRKLSHFVAYPEILDLSAYLSDNIHEISNENIQICTLKVRLYAVIIHFGQNLNNGHLFAYVRGPNDYWYEANDSSVTLVTLHEVLSSHNVYMLFYTEVTSMSTNSKSSSENNLSLSLTNPLQMTDHEQDALVSLENQHLLVIVSFFCK